MGVTALSEYRYMQIFFKNLLLWEKIVAVNSYGQYCRLHDYPTDAMQCPSRACQRHYLHDHRQVMGLFF